MNEIRGLAIQFLLLLFNALPLPVFVMLIIAAINERIRRIVLWTMVGLTVVTLAAYVIFAPRNPVTPDDWGSIFEGLKGGFVSAIPYLVGLVVIGIAAYFIGPFLYESTLGAMDRRARTRYLEAVIELLTPQVEESLDLTAQKAVLESLRTSKPISLRIVGEAGTGKSHLLRLATIELAKQALQKNYLPVPVLVDMDVLLASEKDIDKHPGIFTHPRSMSSLQSLPVPFTDRMLRLQAHKKRLIFLVDSSVHTFSREFLSPTAQTNLLKDLANLVQYFSPCPFLITLPPGISHPELDIAVSEVVDLGLLEDADIDQVMTFANIPTTGSAWAEMARRVLVLKHLVSYAKFRGFGIPPDLRELFRTVLYPGNISPERVDAILIRMSVEIQKARRYTLPQARVESLLRSSGEKRGSAVPLSALTTTGLLRRIEPAEDSGAEMGMVQFGHPLYLAYAIALGWYASQGQISVPSADAYAGDPLLAEALVFFTNIETDPKRFSVALERLAVQDGGTYIVTQCLLAMPPAVRPVHLAVIATEDLVSKYIQDGSMVDQARPMLFGLEPADRLDVLKHVLEGVEPSLIGQKIRQIKTLEGENERALDDIRGLLWHASPSLSREAAQVLAEDHPVEAFRLFLELFERGPADKHALALESFGLLPYHQVEEHLRGLLRSERDPQLRVGVLRAMIASGGTQVLPLIERVGDREEADEVRIYAAQMLAGSSSPEMQSDNIVREIVRVSRVPMPEKARSCLRELIENLRARMPAGVARWEAVVNPFVIGRPVTDPAMFFGREALAHEMRVAVENGSHMLLLGERRIGKTSLLRMFWQQLQDEAKRSVPVRAAYLDLQGLQSNEFYETLVRAVIEQLHEPDLYADTQIERPYTDAVFERDIAGLMEYLHTKHGEHVRLAVLMDEADALSGYPPTMQAAIRRVFTGSAVTGLVLILAGSPAVQRWSQPESPFFGMFAVRPVSRLSPEDATKLITRPVADSFQYEPAAMQAILRATVGRPYEIQALCQRLVNMMLGTGERTITVELVSQALKSSTGGRGELLSEADTILSDLLDWVEMHPEASNAQVQERVQTTWADLLNTMVQQVQQMRKTGPRSN